MIWDIHILEMIAWTKVGSESLVSFYSMNYFSLKSKMTAISKEEFLMQCTWAKLWLNFGVCTIVRIQSDISRIISQSIFFAVHVLFILKYYVENILTNVLIVHIITHHNTYHVTVLSILVSVLSCYHNISIIIHSI